MCNCCNIKMFEVATISAGKLFCVYCLDEFLHEEFSATHLGKNADNMHILKPIKKVYCNKCHQVIKEVQLTCDIPNSETICINNSELVERKN